MIVGSFLLNGHVYTQDVLKEELFLSVENQETEFLKQYLENYDNLELYNNEDESLMYVAVDNWNLPAIEILLENNAAFSYRNIKKLLRTKIDSKEQLSISEENYKAHDRLRNYIEPFESYRIEDSRKTIENFRPALSPPSFNDLKQIFNKAKPQIDLMLARRVRSGINKELNYAGLSTGAGIVLPLFKNYSSQMVCGEKNIAVSEGSDGKTIYFNDAVFQMDQLEMQQSIRQRFSLYFQLAGLYSIRTTQIPAQSPGFIEDITTEGLILDIRSFDISPSLLFKYGIFYLKSGLEIRKNLKTSLMRPVYSENGNYESTDISKHVQPYTTAFVLGLGIDVQFAWIEFGKSFAPTDIFEGVPSAVNWSGVSVGIRF